MTGCSAGPIVRNRGTGRAATVGTADVYNILTQMITPDVTHVVAARAADRVDEGEGPSAEALLATVKAKRDAIRLLAGLDDARRRAEQRERGNDHVPIFQSTPAAGDVLGHGDARNAHGAIHPRQQVPACSFDGGRRVILEQLPRITVQELAAGLPRPKESESLTIAVELRLHDGRSRVYPVSLETYRSGFGRPWLARCARCGRRVRLLYVVPAGDGLVCDACTGATRYAVRFGHRRWYRDVLRHARRSAELQARTAGRRTREATRARVTAAVQKHLSLALAGLRCVGVPADPNAAGGTPPDVLTGRWANAPA